MRRMERNESEGRGRSLREFVAMVVMAMMMAGEGQVGGVIGRTRWTYVAIVCMFCEKVGRSK